ncbi:MAG: apolipoprotein N-acyltransferase [Candidatus Margulisbacteria bacterium]|nr:apolipoprotein N-acyltransferase [Candidatus Margulisiibacteriota bacterium]
MGGQGILIILSALLTVLCFPKFNVFFLAFGCLIPLLYQIETSPKGVLRLFGVGFGYGLFFMGAFHLWIFELTPFGPLWGLGLLWVLLVLLQSVFYGLGTCLIYYLKPYLPLPILVPSVWVLCEWLRHLGPFGNSGGDLGYSQTLNIGFLQWASVGGVWLVTWLIVCINTTLFLALFNRNTHPLQAKKWALWGVCILIISTGLGYGRLLLPSQEKPTLKVALIQGNHPQLFKLDQNNWKSIRTDYLGLTEFASLMNPDIIIWPETVIATFNLDNAWFLKQLTTLSQTLNTPILFGTPIKDQGVNYNTLSLVTPDGLSKTNYQKTILMPFGEYIPLRGLDRKMGINYFNDWNEYRSGKDQPLLRFNTYSIGSAICLESIYPGHLRKTTQKGADFLVTVANNAWFGNSSAAYKHIQMSQLRAVENNRYLVQASNTGISAVISNTGRYLTKTKLNETRIISHHIKIGFQKSMYTRLGDWVIWVSFGFIVFGVGRVIQVYCFL